MNVTFLESAPRVVGRARRANAGAMTEMVRSLLREAGESYDLQDSRSETVDSETPVVRLRRREATDGEVLAARRLRRERSGEEARVLRLRRPPRGACEIDRGGSPAAA